MGASVKVMPDLLTPIAEDPWVADLHGNSGRDCQSTVAFDDHPCGGTPRWYVELEILEYKVANPRWEGKVCSACLRGWQEWAVEESDAITVVSITPISGG